MHSYPSISAIRTDLEQGKVSCLQLTEAYLARICEKASLNAFLETFDADAVAQAKAVDAKLKDGKGGKLAGLVIGIKDNICYKGHRVSSSSRILEGFESLFSATAVERLLAEDAIIIGRLNCDEFAMGSSNENSAFGPVKNPFDETRVPGGSSGGSAAAVAAGLCHATLGSDTGGSIRQPASFCGVVGLKPTYGRVSRWGLVAYASSLDQIGPLTKSVEDAALILEVIAGSDAYDSTAASHPVEAYSELAQEPKKYRIAYLKDCLEHTGLDPEVNERNEQVIAFLQSQGHTVEPINFPIIDKLVPTYNVISNAEASSNLSRFDGIHYGYRSSETQDIESAFVHSRSEGFGREVKRRIMLGTFVLSAGYYDAYYTKAQQVRKLITEQTTEMLANYDFLMSPTTPHTAFPIGSNTNDPIAMYLEDIFTVHANLAGIPSISLPMGEHSNGLPFGIQFTGNRFSEKDLLEFSRYVLEHAT